MESTQAACGGIALQSAASGELSSETLNPRDFGNL
jgi:hypothetical protein